MSSARFTRRRFLHRASAVALAAGTVGLAWEQLTASAIASGSLAKCISMGGPGTLRQEGHPDDYRLWGNRELIRDSQTTWVKLWVSWYELQNELGVAPASRAASWSHLNGAPAGFAYLKRLDAQVRAIKDDGLRVIVTLYHNHPTWASGATGGRSCSASASRQSRSSRSTCRPDGPWAWFISHLLARYRTGVPPNPIGPREPDAGRGHQRLRPARGKPARRIDRRARDLQRAEPPQLAAGGRANSGRCADDPLRRRSSRRLPGGTRILAPATSDFPDSDSTGTGGFVGREWNGFTQRVLAELGGFRPTVPVSWSHHNYRDVRLGEDPTPRRARVWPCSPARRGSGNLARYG